jgi:hypothetical protein
MSRLLRFGATTDADPATDPEEEFRSGEESAHRSENGDKAEIEPHRVATLGNEEREEMGGEMKQIRIRDRTNRRQDLDTTNREGDEGLTDSPEIPETELRHNSPLLPQHRSQRTRSNRDTLPTTKRRTASGFGQLVPHAVVS